MKNDVNSLRYKYTRAVTLGKVDLSLGMHTEKERVYIYSRTAYSWRAWMHKKKVFISYQKIREWLCFHFESDNSWNGIFDTSNRTEEGVEEEQEPHPVSLRRVKRKIPQRKGVGIKKYPMRLLKTNNEKYSYWRKWLSVGGFFFSQIAPIWEKAPSDTRIQLYINISVFSNYRILRNT